MMAKNRCNPAVVAGLMGTAAAVAPVPAYALELPGSQMGVGSEVLFTLLLGCTAGATIMLTVYALRRMRANRERAESGLPDRELANRKRRRGKRASSDERAAAREQAMETGSFIPIADPKNPGQSGPLPDLLHPSSSGSLVDSFVAEAQAVRGNSGPLPRRRASHFRSTAVRAVPAIDYEQSQDLRVSADEVDPWVERRNALRDEDTEGLYVMPDMNMDDSGVIMPQRRGTDYTFATVPSSVDYADIESATPAPAYNFKAQRNPLPEMPYLEEDVETFSDDAPVAKPQVETQARAQSHRPSAPTRPTGNAAKAAFQYYDQAFKKHSGQTGSYEAVATSYVASKRERQGALARLKGVAAVLQERLGGNQMDGVPVIARPDGTVADIGTSWWTAKMGDQIMGTAEAIAEERQMADVVDMGTRAMAERAAIIAARIASFGPIDDAAPAAPAAIVAPAVPAAPAPPVASAVPAAPAAPVATAVPAAVAATAASVASAVPVAAEASAPQAASAASATSAAPVVSAASAAPAASVAPAASASPAAPAQAYQRPIVNPMYAALMNEYASDEPESATKVAVAAPAAELDEPAGAVSVFAVQPANKPVKTHAPAHAATPVAASSAKSVAEASVAKPVVEAPVAESVAPVSVAKPAAARVSGPAHFAQSGALASAVVYAASAAPKAPAHFAEPVAKPIARPVAAPVAEPAAESVAAASAAQPAAESVAKPVAAPAAEPVAAAPVVVPVVAAVAQPVVAAPQPAPVTAPVDSSARPTHASSLANRRETWRVALEELDGTGTLRSWRQPLLDVNVSSEGRAAKHFRPAPDKASTTVLPRTLELVEARKASELRQAQEPQMAQSPQHAAAPVADLDEPDNLSDPTLVLERRVRRVDTQTSLYVNSLVKEELAKSTASSVRARLRVMNGGTGGWRKGDVEDALAQTTGEAGDKHADRPWLNAREA